MGHIPAEVRFDVIAGPAQGRVIRIQQSDRFVVGRGPEARVRIDDDFMSRQHFVVEANPPDVQLRDLGSKNGVLVNGRRYGGTRPAPAHIPQDESPGTPLRDGDVVQLGRTKIRVGTTEATGGAPTIERMARAFFTQDGIELLDRYELLDTQLTSGAMGELFIGRDKTTGRKVAIKTLRPQFAARPRRVQAFLRECEVATQLDHPNICRAHDAGFADGRLFLVMDYIDGPTLRSVMSAGPMSLDRAGPLMLQILDGLAYAHAAEVETKLETGEHETFRGVVHRDLKPGNIMIDEATDPATPKLVDFGLAKAFDAAGRFGLTSEGQMAGTVFYWPREHITAYRYLGPPSDVFSVAAVFYEMLTGHYVRDGFSALAERLQRTPPVAAYSCMILRNPVTPLAERMPKLPTPVTRVIDRALSEEDVVLEMLNRDEALEARERLAALRFPDAGAFREALAETLQRNA